MSVILSKSLGVIVLRRPVFEGAHTEQGLIFDVFFLSTEIK